MRRLEITYRRYRIPSRYLGEEGPCLAQGLCPPCFLVPDDPGDLELSDPIGMDGELCSHNWFYSFTAPEECEPCDPENPADWWLQYLVNRFTRFCSGPFAAVFAPLCQIALCAQYILDTKDPEIDEPVDPGGCDSIYLWWFETCEWWTAWHCAHPDTDPPFDNRMAIQYNRVVLPPGSEFVEEFCETLDLDEICDPCLPPP